MDGRSQLLTTAFIPRRHLGISSYRWFISQSFEPVEPPSDSLASSINWLASVGESMRSAMAMIPIKAIMIVALSAALFSALLVQLYRYVLRPKVVREHLKTE